MNERNWRRSRTMRAHNLATCLRDGHDWAENTPRVYTCVRCGAVAAGHDPATLENVVRCLEQALGPWPPEN